MARGDVDACLLRVRCMLEGQYVEICPLKGAVIRTYWNACIGRLKQARKFPRADLAGKVTRGCPAGTVPGGSTGKETNHG